MSVAIKKSGRPISTIKSAQAKYQSLKTKRDIAIRDFNDFEKHCIKEGLLMKVENPEKAVTVKSFIRRHFDRIWAE